MKPKLWLLTGALLFLILISTAPALASTNNGATTEVQVGNPAPAGAAGIIPYE